MPSISPVPAPRSLVPGSRSPVPKTLRVLMLAPTPFFSDRGCHVRIYEEAKALLALGHSVHIVTYHIGRDMPGINISRTPIVPWYSRLEAGPSWHKSYLDILLYAKAYRTAQRFRPDLIHAHLHEGALIGSFLKKKLKIPLLFDYQGSLTGESLDHGFMRRDGMICRMFRRLEEYINRSADHIITSSSPAAAMLVDEWGMPEDKVSPFIDGVDTDLFLPRDGNDTRRRLGIPEDAFLAVYLGVLNSYQGVDLLMDSISMISKRDSRIHFLVMGYPEAGYREMAVAAGLQGRVTFTGKVDYSEAPLFLSAGDAAVSPKLSLTEANGKLLNYLACGLPAVAFDTPVNREILGDAALYAEYGSAGSLADRICELASARDLRLKLSVESRARAVREHSWDSRVNILIKKYFELLSAAQKEDEPG